jgi:hypothetical protein
MSKNEPKSPKNMSAQQTVETLFHPKALGNAKSMPRARRNRGRKAHKGGWVLD